MMYRTRRAALIGALATVVPTGTALAEVDPHPGMLRYPDISKSHIVFAYANDLWIVDRDGGMASPLASPSGQESFPRFSEDGRTIAFQGNYDGGRDLYTIDIDGGNAYRVTHHPTGESLCDWVGDELLFSASGIAGLNRQPKLHMVDAEGGMPSTVPVPYGARGAVSADGEWIAYTPNNRDTRTWKRYRGGMASDIWLFNLNSHESVRMTDWEGTDTSPMWQGDKVYYLSDNGDSHRLNIWRYDTENGRHKQITDFDDYDVKWPAIGPGKRGRGEIIFQHGPTIKVLDLSNNRVRDVDISIPGARPTLRNKRVDAAGFIGAGNISSTGKRAVVAARGDIWTAPAKNGSPRNLTHTDGVHERDPAWSPDGRWIAYFSDATGEYELYVTQSDGKGETKQLTEDSETFYQTIQWSPDSEMIVFHDKAANVYLHTLETGETEIIDRDPWGNAMPVTWSHDSRWVAYAKSSDSPITSIWAYDLENGEHHQLTSGMFPDSSPAFDRKGDYLYYTSIRSFRPSYSDVDGTFIYDESQVLVAMPLRADVESPWLPESDEEEWDDEEEDEEEEEEEGDEGDDEEADDDESDDESDEADDAPKSPIHGTWEGTINGLSAMGAPPEMDSMPFTMVINVAADGTISGSSEVMGESDSFDEVSFDEATGTFSATSEEMGITSTMKGKLDGDQLSGTWEVAGPMSGSGTWEATKSSDEGDVEDDGDSDEAAEVVEIEVEDIERRTFQIPVGSGNFGNLAVNHKNQLLYVRMGNGGFGIKMYDLGDDDASEQNVATAGGFLMSADGKKILIPRGSGGAIQNAGSGSAEPLSTNGMMMSIDPREEWEQILREAWRIHRDFFYVENLHGVDWDAIYDQYAAMLADCVTREDVSYIIGEMIAELNVGHAYYWGGDGESESFVGVGMLGVEWELEDDHYRIGQIIEGAPWDLDAKNPLNRLGADINEGDYVLAVNGAEMDTSMDPWAAFIGTAGREITLTVSETPVWDENARDVVIVPIGSERNLRYRAWIEHNRKYVEEQTDGRIGYIYVPNTGVDGQNDLVRQYVGQIGHEGLIIDERWNGGGQIPDRFIEMLNRPVTNAWARRDGKDWVWPATAHHGPKCMLINGLAGSGGDMFPWLFKHNGLGKLIGTRTWGGLVGISGNPSLIDGGYTAVPTFGFYEKDGTWGIEGHGVDPDIEVIDDPALMVDGGDPQLDAAIAHMLEEVERIPYVAPKRPQDPQRAGMGIAEEDK